MPVSSIALHIPRNSQGWPTHILNPAGLPPDSLRILAMNCIISIGVENALWRAGEMQSSPIGTPLILAISSDTFPPRRTPPCPGLAPWLILSSTLLIWSSLETRADSLGLNVRPRLRQPE